MKQVETLGFKRVDAPGHWNEAWESDDSILLLRGVGAMPWRAYRDAEPLRATAGKRPVITCGSAYAMAVRAIERWRK